MVNMWRWRASTTGLQEVISEVSMRSIIPVNVFQLQSQDNTASGGSESARDVATCGVYRLRGRCWYCTVYWLPCTMGSATSVHIVFTTFNGRDSSVLTQSLTSDWINWLIYCTLHSLMWISGQNCAKFNINVLFTCGFLWTGLVLIFAIQYLQLNKSSLNKLFLSSCW